MRLPSGTVAPCLNRMVALNMLMQERIHIEILTMISSYVHAKAAHSHDEPPPVSTKVDWSLEVDCDSHYPFCQSLRTKQTTIRYYLGYAEYYKQVYKMHN